MGQRILATIGLLVSLVAGGSAEALSIDWVTVGAAGNAADVTGLGAVSYSYRISKYETTNAQYAEFLNAVAKTDTKSLYNSSMGSSVHGGIARTGIAGTYSYSTRSGMADKPVNFVSFWDSLRFANWLHNGQPTGANAAAATEGGAYTITSDGVNAIERNTNASIFLTNRDEWYKAAYYDAMSASYFEFPAGTDTPTACGIPGAMPNTANCDLAVGTVTGTGAYTGAASPFGTFDQGGNVREWAEFLSGITPRILGGGWDVSLSGRPRPSGVPGNAALRSTSSAFGSATIENAALGFRVGSTVPEPSTAVLLGIGLVGLAAMRRDLVSALSFGHRNSSASFSDGFIHSRVGRGRSLSM